MLRQLKSLSNTIFRPIQVKTLPIHLQLEITNACNLKCIMCTRDRLIETPKTMSFESFKEIYDQVRPQKINISGLGEPFMNRDILKIASYAKRNGSTVNLATNFTLVDRYMDKIIGSGIDQFKVSIDSTNRETYLKIRGMDKFDNIISSIKEINLLKEKGGVTKPEIRFNFALQSENIDQLDGVINLAYELNIKSIYFQYLEYIDMEDRKALLVEGLNLDKLKERLTHAAHEADKKNISTNLHVWLKDIELYSRKMQAFSQFEVNDRLCSFPWFSTFIEVNGDVKPCPIFVWKRNHGKMGNVFKERFEEIWNNESYKNLRMAFNNRQHSLVPCQTCIPQKLTNLLFIYSKMLPMK